MNEEKIQIDESTHKVVPTTVERVKNALISVLFGFLLIQIIGFWVFPGLGWGGLYAFSYSTFSSIINFLNIYLIAFLVICAVWGWFRGQYFVGRLKSYINFWRFW